MLRPREGNQGLLVCKNIHMQKYKNKNYMSFDKKKALLEESIVRFDLLGVEMYIVIWTPQ